MTTKTVAVQLVAMTNQYKSAMAGATASTAKLQTTATGASGVIGKVMGPQLALAGAVAGGVAVKLAMDWEDAFTRIGAITDSSQAQVGQWKEQVKSLAGETGRAPVELAEALYFLASAGLDASEIMPTLEMSAKAAAVGLGETADIARLTANAMNAYQASGLKAAEVTDILVAAVREGTAEPDEFADAMGRILPIASKAGITFDQVAASLATVSNAGLDVNEGVTAMRGVMMSLLGPGPQAVKMLEELGLSADQVRDSLAEDGLIATLRLLEERTGGNIDQMRKIIPNVRALAGAFNLTGQDMEKVNEIFEDVKNSSGDAGAAFRKTGESDMQKLREAFAEIQVAAIEFGTVALPPLATALSAIAETISDLIALGHDFAAAYGGTADVLGAALIPGERFRQTFNDVRDSLAAGTMSADQARKFLGYLREEAVFDEASLAELDSEITEVSDGMQRAGMVTGGYTGNLAGVGQAAEATEAPIEGLKGGVQDAAASMDEAEGRANDLNTALMTLAGIALDVEEASLGWHQAMADLNDELQAGERTLDITSQAGRDNREAFKSAAEAAIEHGEAVAMQTGSVKQGVGVVADHIAQLREQAIQAGFTEDEIDAYIRKLNLTPKEIRTLIKNNAEEAAADLEAYWQKLFRLNGQSVTTYVNQIVTTEGRETGHAGGVVGDLPKLHQGGVANDEVLVLARKGETIRTVAQEKALMQALQTSPASTMPSVINLYVGEHKVDSIVLGSLRREAARRGAV